MVRVRAAGFTLLEVMIALGVFAIVAIAVYARSGEVMAQTGQLESRTLGTWIARNTLTRLELEARAGESPSAKPLSSGRDTRAVRMAGREWRVTTNVAETEQRYLQRITVTVSGANDVGLRHEGNAARVTGFLGRY